MGEAILRRICRDAGMPDLLEVLADRIPPTDLQTVLLETARRRAGARSPADLLGHYGRDRTTMPGTADARLLARLVVAALEAAPAYTAVNIAPVEPLGLNVALGGIDQNNVLATVRATEVVSDPTSALALEAAVRRRAGTEVVRLCACHRVLRMQPFDAPGAQQHFLLHALVTAERSRPGHTAELRALREHVEAYLRLIAAAREMGTRVEDVCVRISDTRVHALLREWGVAPRADVDDVRDAVGRDDARRLGRRLQLLEGAAEALAPLRGQFPESRIVVDLTRSHAVAYYAGLQLQIDATVAGAEVNLADGGSVDWGARLMSDRSERAFTSGLGLERLVH
jgi:hypothetical protein